MVKIKRIYDPASPDDGKRILVDLLWPRGLKKEDAAIDEWLKDVAPSPGLRKWFGHDPEKWRDFRRRYKDELKEKTGIVERLRQEVKAQTVTLLFAARDVEHNNAEVLREIIAR
jgi:uncharacterized protein YeaO (DUF488 family)